MEDIGDRIRQLRNSQNGGKGMNQAEFADKLGRKHGIVSVWERGKSIDDKTVNAICFVFGVSGKWLKDGIGEMTPKGTERESELLEKFRQLTPDVQDLILRYVDTLLENQRALQGSPPAPEMFVSSIKPADTVLKERSEGGAAG